VTSSDFVCDSCGDTFPIGDQRLWRQEEMIQASTLSGVGGIRARGAPTPLSRSVYATREYRLCPACFSEIGEPIEQDMAFQRRGVIVVAVIGLIALIGVMIAAAMHADLFRSPHDQHKGALGAMPIPYTNPLPTIPSAGN
jgi:hypothetical protein